MEGKRTVFGLRHHIDPGCHLIIEVMDDPRSGRAVIHLHGYYHGDVILGVYARRWHSYPAARIPEPCAEGRCGCQNVLVDLSPETAAEEADPPRYTYSRDKDGTYDTLHIHAPDGSIVAGLYFWDEPDTDEAKEAEQSARHIVEQLNRWRRPEEWQQVAPETGGTEVTTRSK
jgi:hypothetical protein